MTTLAHVAPSVIRVLAVDDESFMLGVYTSLFEEFMDTMPAGGAGSPGEGPGAWRIDTCDRGEDAVERVRLALEQDDPYAVIFMDVRMPPGQDGISSAEAIRALDPFVHIVIASGHTDFTLAEIAERIPPRDRVTVVEKPLRGKEIHACAQQMAMKWLEERRQTGTALPEHVDLDGRMRYHNQVLVDLAHSTAHSRGDLEAAWQEITQTAATTLGAQRVGIWLINHARDTLRCASVYDSTTDTHTEGGILRISDHPEYFAAIGRKRVIVTQDVASVPGLASLVDGYFQEHGIVATLDATIRVRGQVLGVVCHEQIGQARPWNLLDLQFAGSIADFVALSLEAYDSVRSEHNLRSSQSRYQGLLENARAIVFTCTLDGAILAINPAASTLTGYTVDELSAMPLQALLAPGYGRIWQNEVARQQRGEATPVTRLELLARDGRRIPVDINAWPLYEQGEVTGIQAIARDVTEQVKAEQEKAHLEEQLRTSQRLEAIGRLAGGIAHDFNNLLTAILGTSELLLSEMPEDSPYRRDIIEITKAGQRAATLTRQLLAFGRKQILQPKVIDLNAIVVNIEHMLRRIIGEDIDLIAQLQPDLPIVRADPGQIEQVIVNLVVNARDAMPRGGALLLATETVEVEARVGEGDAALDPGRYACLRIVDDGCGMPPEVLEHIFEPFFTTKGELGTGLGLSTVYGIVRQSGGAIHVSSAENKGTAFRIYLPHIDAALPDKESPPPAAPERGVGRVLLVEDDEGLRELTLRVLRGLGYEVIAAANAHEALRRCQDDPIRFNLLLTDVVMPLMNGDELAEKLLDNGSVERVLFMSGYTDDRTTGPRSPKRGECFLQKPFTPITLAQKVRDALEAAPEPEAE